MDNMTFSKALLLFELKNNYTEEELKKKYRELTNIYHPDKHTNASQKEKEEFTRKVQDINIAYEILKKHLNNNSTNTKENLNRSYNTKSNQSYEYSTKYNEKLILERKKVKKIISKYFKYCQAEKLMNRVSNLILDYVMKVDISLAPDLTFVNFKIDLEILYRKYIDTYCQKHNIPLFLIKKQNFNFNADCKNLFEQLKDCERTIGVDLSKIIRKYKYHDYFNILESKILEERDIIKLKINYNTNQKEYTNIIETYSDIINKLLVDYTCRYREFKYALDKISRQLDDKIKKYLYDNIQEIVLKYNEDELTELLISAYKESKQKKQTKNKPKEKDETISQNEKKNNSSKLNAREKIYSELKRKYILKTNQENNEIIDALFIKATELLYNEKCNMKVVLEINNITFENPLEEYTNLIKLSNTERIKTEEFIDTENIKYELNSQIYKTRK